jgi:hypothetical protein
MATADFREVAAACALAGLPRPELSYNAARDEWAVRFRWRSAGMLLALAAIAEAYDLFETHWAYVKDGTPEMGMVCALPSRFTNFE